MQWQSLSISREKGELEFAEGCLQRLWERRTNKSQGQDWRLSLEEANLMGCNGNFETAVWDIKNIVDEQLRQPPTGCIVELLELKADSLLYCGTWTKHQKIKSAKCVQEIYLVPAMSACQDLWKKQESPENQRRLLRCCLTLANTATILFQSAHDRIMSKEWKANKKDMLEKKLELHAILALRSLLGESLPLCNKLNETSHKHVLRFASIWFSTHLLVPHINEVNEVVDSLFQTILTFWFLPLIDQLLWQLLCMGRGLEHAAFQMTLLNFIVLMCKQHPYHCLPQLCSLIHSEDGRGWGEDCPGGEYYVLLWPT